MAEQFNALQAAFAWGSPTRHCSFNKRADEVCLFCCGETVVPQIQAMLTFFTVAMVPCQKNSPHKHKCQCTLLLHCGGLRVEQLMSPGFARNKWKAAQCGQKKTTHRPAGQLSCTPSQACHSHSGKVMFHNGCLHQRLCGHFCLDMEVKSAFTIGLADKEWTMKWLMTHSENWRGFGNGT